MAWPLVNPSRSTGARAATAAAFSAVETSWSDMMVVALPQGTKTAWQYDQAAAAAATAAAQAAVQFKSPFGHRWGNGKGRRSASGSKTSSGPTNSGSGGSAKQQASWFETPYAAAWQYNREKSMGGAYFMATSWAALWPVFLQAAAQRSTMLTPQAKADLKQELSVRWQEYQQALSGKNFPQGNGQQLLPQANVFAAFSAEPSTAGAASAERGAGSSSSGDGGGSGSSFGGAGDGLWPYLHSIYFQDAENKVPRSPYDLARDKKLWVTGAYETLEQALDMVDVDDKKTAIKALQNVSERSVALGYLKC